MASVSRAAELASHGWRMLAPGMVRKQAMSSIAMAEGPDSPGVRPPWEPQSRIAAPPTADIRTNSKARVVNDAKVEVNGFQPRAARPVAAATIACSAMYISK